MNSQRQSAAAQMQQVVDPAVNKIEMVIQNSNFSLIELERQRKAQ